MLVFCLAVLRGWALARKWRKGDCAPFAGCGRMLRRVATVP